MDFRGAALPPPPPPPAAHMAGLFGPGPLAPPPPPAGMFLYPGLQSPVKPVVPHLPVPPATSAGGKVSRSTAAVPPLSHQGGATSAAAAAQSSSFAAALKSLARNAGGADGKESSSAPGSKPPREPMPAAPAMSPKRVPLHVPRAAHNADNRPPVVAIAPTHQRREPAAVSVAPDISKPEIPHSSSSGGAGFQPYRSEERALAEAMYPAGYPVAGGAALYPPLPAAVPPGYGARRPEDRYLESLYQLNPALQHQLYGLEEQLYLERLGLLRPGALAVGGLPGGAASAAAAYAPLLSAARYPPELLHSPLYLSQSLYLQERLKLEEDTRLKLESEREKDRERERDREKTRERRACSPVRDRSPIRPPASSAAATAHCIPHEQRNGSVHDKSPRARSTSGSDHHSSPAAYRPYLSSPVQKPATSGAPPALDLSRATGKNGAICAEKKRSHKKTTVVRPFEDAPVTVSHVPEAPLNLSPSIGATPPAAPPPAPAAVHNGFAPYDAAQQRVPAPAVAADGQTTVKMEVETKPEPAASPADLTPAQQQTPTENIDKSALPNGLPECAGAPAEKPPPCDAGGAISAPSALATYSYRHVSSGTSPSPSGVEVVVPSRNVTTVSSADAGSAEDVYAFTEEAAPAPDRLHPLHDKDAEVAVKTEQPETTGCSSQLSADEGRGGAATSSDAEWEPRRPPSPDVRHDNSDVPAKLVFLDRLGLRPAAASTPAEEAAAAAAAAAASPGGSGSSAAVSSPTTSAATGPRPSPPAAVQHGSVAGSPGAPGGTAGAAHRRTEARAVTFASSGSGSGHSSSGSGAEDAGRPASRRSTRSSRAKSARASPPAVSPPAAAALPAPEPALPAAAAAASLVAAAAPATAAPMSAAAPVLPVLPTALPMAAGLAVVGGSEVAALPALGGLGWPGLQAVTQMYTAYNKERAAALEQAKRHGDQLRTQKARLEETSRTLALRLNRQVSYKNLQWQRRDAVQEQIDRLTSLVRSLPQHGRRKR